MGPRPLLIVLALAGIADADKLTTKYVDGENIHIAGNGGAINRHRAVTIALDLHANAKAKAIDSGSDRDHHLYADGGTTEEKVVWTNTWSGTWKKTGATLVVALKLDDRKCTKTKTYNRGAPATEPCRTITKQLELACTSETIDVETGRATTKRPAWRC